MDITSWLPIVLLSGAGSLFGGAFAVLLARRQAKGTSLTMETRENIIKNAERQRSIILEEALKTAREQFEQEAERLEEERAIALRLHVDFEKEVEKRDEELAEREQELTALDSELSAKELNVRQIENQAHSISLQRREAQALFESQLESKAGVEREELHKECYEHLIDDEKLAANRWLFEHGERLKTESQRFAKHTLSVVLARYSPSFVWPKSSFSVQLASKEVAERHFGEESDLVSLLVAGTETSVDVLYDNESVPTVRIVGGAGTDKEVIRLVLEELMGKGNVSIDRARSLVQKYRKQVDKYILKLGEDAAKILELKDLHPEILKLIGSLNYRTSHRQNQYYHSLEVARLAGMLAQEIGVDGVLAKRSGILHDIGKALDYKIEGSHAVISGDYANRFGEKEVVVDTVLSHHDDKIVETPHAYILKAADAMSGARPGARVDMEEGYQKRIEGIAEVVKSFEGHGVTGTAIMSAGREVHVFVDNRKIKERDTSPLATQIARKLESDVQFPGQIKVTVVRRLEISEVA